MEALKGLPKDFSKALETSFNVLKICNVRYLEDGQPFLKKNWRFFYIGLTVLIHIVTMGLRIPELLKGKEMTRFAYLLPSILVTVHTVLKSIVLIPKTRQVSVFIKDLGSLWREELTTNQKKEKETLLWQLNFINRVSFWISASGSPQYLLLPLLGTLFRRFILEQDCELLLPFSSSYPFNPTKNWGIYILVYIFQLYSMTLLVTMYVGSALIMTTMCALLAIEFIMIRDDLARVKPKLNQDKSCSDSVDGPDIETFVKRHLKLLRLSRQLDNIFNGMVFIDLLFVGITTCAFSFMGQFAGGPGYMWLSYMGIAASMLTVLYLCYYGELLTRASSSIGDTAYNNMWYKGGNKYKIAILLIIKISQKPCRLTSLRYAVVSMNMFTKVISSTWSYFSLMNSVYSEESTSSDT